MAGNFREVEGVVKMYSVERNLDCGARLGYL